MRSRRIPPPRHRPRDGRRIVTMFTEELPWLQGRGKDLVMGQAICNWLGWKRLA
jgi:hypothetical protein